MNLAHLPHMPFSSIGWKELQDSHPSVTKLFLQIALPLSLFPPVMLYYAGTHYGDSLTAAKHWELIALAFFLAEMVTFYAMGWLIKEITHTYQIELSRHDAYLLAAICPIPLWLSSLALLEPSLPFNIAASLLALTVSYTTIYNGIQAFCHMRGSQEEETLAAGISFSVMSAAIISWLIPSLLIIMSI